MPGGYLKARISSCILYRAAPIKPLSIDETEQEVPRHEREGSIESIASAVIDHVALPNRQPKRKPAAAQGEPPAKRQKKAKAQPTHFETTIEWPEHFKRLEQTFKALNTVYTFASSRRHLATTFENLRNSVEGLLKRPLEIHDIAQFKSLMPKVVKFAYTDPQALLLIASSKAAEKDADFAPAPEKGSEQVLLFEFIDGELKSSNGAGKVITRKWHRHKTAQKAGDSPLVPKFTADGMTKLIDKRNARFKDAVNELLLACATQDQDAVQLLLDATEDHVPVQPSTSGPGPMPLRERRAGLDYFIQNPNNRPSIESLIQELQSEEDYKEQIVEGGHYIVDAREALYGNLDEPLSQPIMDALYETKGIKQLYAHQAEAINHLARGNNVIVATSTSSGKSLIYQLPALQAFEKDLASTAIYIYPTKALAQDQKRALTELLACCEHLDPVKIATFDGDTPQEERDFIRENANVIFTNPDMLHITIMPREEEWRRFFRNLKLVVVDELHMYNGLFGCHVALVMRRLRRICAAVGNEDIRFVSCSATINDPDKHMSCVFGVENVHLVDVDGSPCGRKEWVVWNPPMIDPHDVTQGRISTVTETSRLFRFLMDRGVRTIVFCKVRKICEVVIKQTRTDLALEGRDDLSSRVMSYRSGYSAQDRRDIEQKMFRGELLGIVATTALELGIDIGSLDAVITVGFPYTLPGLRQQAGRAGRRNKDSLAMLICAPFPLDQHYAAHPEELHTKGHATLTLDLDNRLVLEGHLQCAAEEMPIHPKDDLLFFGPSMPQICRERLIEDEQGFYHCHPRFRPYPSRHVPIRSTEDERYQIIDITGGRYHVLEEVEWSRAVFEVYEGALFLHQGKSFLVKEISHDSRIAKLEESNVEWSTRVRDFTDIDAIETLRIREIRNSVCRAYYGRVQIQKNIFGYFKVGKRNNILDTIDVDTPPFRRESHGLWLDLPKVAMDILALKNLHPAGSIHAAEHALMSLTPLFVMSSAGDVRTECKTPEREFARRHTHRKRPARITLYDAAGKSGGVCAKAFDNVNALLQQAHAAIARCNCAEGCPQCITSTACPQQNIVVSKLGARVVLEVLLGHTIDLDSIPTQPAMQNINPSETIVLQGPVRVSEDVVVLSANGSPLPRERATSNRGAEEFFEVPSMPEPSSEGQDIQPVEGGFVRGM